MGPSLLPLDGGGVRVLDDDDDRPEEEDGGDKEGKRGALYMIR